MPDSKVACTMHAVQSTNLHSIGNASDGALFVVFRSSSTNFLYAYPGQGDTLAELLEHPHPGKRFHAWLREDKREHVKIAFDGPPEWAPYELEWRAFDAGNLNTPSVRVVDRHTTEQGPIDPGLGGGDA